jgi:hypothetical protein
MSEVQAIERKESYTCRSLSDASTNNPHKKRKNEERTGPDWKIMITKHFEKSVLPNKLISMQTLTNSRSTNPHLSALCLDRAIASWIPVFDWRWLHIESGHWTAPPGRGVQICLILLIQGVTKRLHGSQCTLDSLTRAHPCLTAQRLTAQQRWQYIRV